MNASHVHICSKHSEWLNSLLLGMQKINMIKHCQSSCTNKDECKNNVVLVKSQALICSR